jgi:hypothetical protein
MVRCVMIETPFTADGGSLSTCAPEGCRPPAKPASTWRIRMQHGFGSFSPTAVAQRPPGCSRTFPLCSRCTKMTRWWGCSRAVQFRSTVWHGQKHTMASMASSSIGVILGPHLPCPCRPQARVILLSLARLVPESFWPECMDKVGEAVRTAGASLRCRTCPAYHAVGNLRAVQPPHDLSTVSL